MLKQVFISMAVIAVATAILTGTVLYTVHFLRLCEAQILSGELSGVRQSSITQTN